MLLSLKQQEGAPPRGSLVVEQFLAKYGQEYEAETGQPLKKVALSMVKIMEQKPGSP